MRRIGLVGRVPGLVEKTYIIRLSNLAFCQCILVLALLLLCASLSLLRSVDNKYCVGALYYFKKLIGTV